MERETESTTTALVPRRSILDTILGAGVATTAVAALYPVSRFLVPPAGGEPSTASVVAARLADLRPELGHRVPVRHPAGHPGADTGRRAARLQRHLHASRMHGAVLVTTIAQIWCACCTTASTTWVATSCRARRRGRLKRNSP